MEIIAYVIMPEHFHMICNSRSLRKAVQSLKSFSAKEIIKQLFSYNEIDFLEKFRMNKLKFKIESEFQIWQEGIILRKCLIILYLNRRLNTFILILLKRVWYLIRKTGNTVQLNSI